MSEFIVSSEYPGYVFVGSASGSFVSDRSGEQVSYANMYVLSPVSDSSKKDYKAHGFKAEKHRCLNADVYKDLQIGDRVKLFFDDKARVQLAVQDN